MNILYSQAYFPKLVGDYYGNNSPITKSWRHLMRQRAKNTYTLAMLLQSSNDATAYAVSDKISILKEICNSEMKHHVRMKKIQRNNERALLSLHGIRANIPLDMINNIQEYMTFVKYF